jgi:hypothetical protein
MLDVDFNMSSKDEDDFKSNTMNDVNEHEIGGTHGNNTNDIFRDVNNNSFKLDQGEQEPNDPYTFADKKEFNMKPKVGGNVVFAQLLINKGLNFDPF